MFGFCVVESLFCEFYAAMSEPGKVRLVRCPKCENLLPELPDYSVYQCGGCGTVLRGIPLHHFLQLVMLIN